ncbi:hypothetical protein NIES2104_58280 [Leptolyngbya sp. NIES-2104]|nr:hypothetical protein NIES2104_58280 [Leptolyngbya sp. NIES-2104]
MRIHRIKAEGSSYSMISGEMSIDLLPFERLAFRSLSWLRFICLK